MQEDYSLKRVRSPGQGSRPWLRGVVLAVVAVCLIARAGAGPVEPTAAVFAASHDVDGGTNRDINRGTNRVPDPVPDRVNVHMSEQVNPHGADLGVIGPVYPIAEPNFLEWIGSQLQARQANGDLQRLQNEARQRVIEHVNNPPPVAGITAAEWARTFYFDPTYTLERNLVDQDGRLLFAAGTRKNPLEVVSLSTRLLFFDARDPGQVKRARALINFYQGRVKPILTGGSFLSLMKVWRTQVYYDQYGVLTRRLGIEHVPAIVSQEGMRLRIDELGARP